MSLVTQVPLALAMVAAGHACVLAATPPNLPPQEKDRHETDSMKWMTGGFAVFGRRVVFTAIAYHALLSVLPQFTATGMAHVCPQSEQINSQLFSWNPVSITCLLLIYIGAYLRLSAYSGLGKSFTFHLAKPDHLVTTGMYRWVQHPSYTGAGLLMVGEVVLFLRWDATPACWVPQTVLSQLQGWGPGMAVAFIGAGWGVFGLRVLDEESMLRQSFGQEWEKWHQSTKRFIPGLI